MTLYFVRHGETEWNVKKKIQGTTDIPLNENGVAQARRLAEELLEKKERGEFQVAKAYTSPQLRASETAQIAADALGVECIPLDGLKEMDLGEWEGSNWDIIRETYGDVYHYWNNNRRYTNTPGGECYNQVLERTLEALTIILEQETENVIVVSHSAILMALRCYIAKRPFEDMVKHFKTKNAEVVEISAEDVREAIRRFAAGE